MKALIELLDHLEVERVFRPGRLGRRYGGDPLRPCPSRAHQGAHPLLPRHAQNLGVVVLHRATHGDEVVGRRSPHTPDLAGGDGGADAGAAHEDAAISPPVDNGLRGPEGDLRVGDIGLGQISDGADALIPVQMLFQSILES